MLISYAESQRLTFPITHYAKFISYLRVRLNPKTEAPSSPTICVDRLSLMYHSSYYLRSLVSLSGVINIKTWEAAMIKSTVVLRAMKPLSRFKLSYQKFHPNLDLN